VITLTRDDPRYWDHKPDDHNEVGLYDIGPWEKTGIPACPQEKRPSLFFDIKTGDANKAPETETREAILAREELEKARRLLLMAEAEEIRREARINRISRALAGQFTGRNRNRKKTRKAA
jgi:hypothetical protein